jgi:myo-inositol catabolism protein IolS
VQYTQLGRTGIQVSSVALGCWGLIGGLTWGPQDESTSIATVHAALDAGITFFDTAEGYGDGYSEQLVGRALAGVRQRVVIATKVSADHLAAAALQEACDRSLRNLGTDYIDLYQVHWPSRTVRFAQTWAALESLRSEGKVRFIGVSNFGVGDLADLLAIGRPQTNQLPYSLLGRGIEFEILPKCVTESIGVLCYSPLAQGLLADRFKAPSEVPDGRARTRHFSGSRPHARHGEAGCETETFAALDRVRAISRRIGQPMGNVSLAWLARQPGVCSVVAGARTPAQIRQTAKAGDLSLADEVILELGRATEDVKRLLGPNPDLWQSTSRYR